MIRSVSEPEEQAVTVVAQALADRTRFRIFRAIARHDNITCGDLAKKFPIAQATVSHHLKVLVGAGLVSVTCRGQFRHFKAVRAALDLYRRTLGGLIGATGRKA